MHKKDQGKLGEAAVIQQCLKNGVEVFTDFGDNSKIDLVLNTKSRGLVKVQVKCFSSNKNGTICFTLRKHGPNYKYKYTSIDVDYFAVVNCHDLTQIAWLESAVICEKYSNGIHLRISQPKNNQKKDISWFKDFTTFPFGSVGE